MLKLVKRKTSKQHVSIKEFCIHGHENKNKTFNFAGSCVCERKADLGI